MDIEKSGKSIEDDKKQGRRAMPNTVDLATFYKQNGFCILPLMRGAKKSVTKWKGYEDGALPNPDPLGMEKGKNYAVLCGAPSNGLVILDFEKMEDAKAFVGQFSTDILKLTFGVMTPHGGVHLYFRSLKPAGRKLRIFGDEHPIDILGEKGYAVVPPAVVDHTKCDPKKEDCPHEGTSAYEVIGALSIIESNDIYNTVVTKGKELGWELKKEKRSRTAEGKPQDIAPPIFLTDEQIAATVSLMQPVYRPGYRDLICMYLSGYLRLAGVQQSQSEKIIETLAKKDPMHGDIGKAVRTVDDTYRKAGIISGYMGLDDTIGKMSDVDGEVLLGTLEEIIRAGHRIGQNQETIDKARGMGFEVKAPRKENESESVDTEFKSVTSQRVGDFWYEQIEGEAFVKWNLKTGEFEIVNSFTIDTKMKKEKKEIITVTVVGIPVRDKCVQNGQIILPKAPIPTDNSELSSIVAEIVSKTPAWLFINEDERVIFEVQVRIAITSWFQYVFDDPHIPERVGGAIGILGSSGSGKKRWGSIIQAISYRGLRIMGTNRVPSVYRLAEIWGQPTLIFEEADQKDTSSAADFIQFYNARYDGIPISRYNTMTGKVDQIYSFGLSALILRRPLEDEGATNRTVWLHSKASKVELPEVAGPDMYEEFADIRARLLYLRLANMGKLKFTGKSDLPVEDSWRVRESLTLFRLLSQLDPNVAEDLNDISKKLTEREVAANSMTWDGIVLGEIYDFLQRDDVVTGNRKGLLYAYKTTKNDKGEALPSYPLTSQDLAKRFDQSVRSIISTIRQFGITTDRIRIGNRLWKGVLFISDRDELIYQFKRYVPNFDGSLLQKFTHQLEKYQDSVPDVPDVPGEWLSS